MELSGAENQSIMPNDPASIVGGIQGAGDVQLTNASINVVGRDSHSHTHVHYHGTTKDLRTILDAIYSFRNIQQDTLAKATPGTVKWLFVSEFFSVWWNQDGNITILWGSGIPGAGKTVLASLVIDAIEHHAADPARKICVAYFYMRYSEHSEVTVRTVLEVLVKQTLECHEDLLPFVEQAYARHMREGTRPTEDQLLALLRQFTAHMAITFYILDALDEAPIDIQHDLIAKLASLNARIFVTSRPMQDVQACFPAAHCFEIAAHDGDLELHISKKLQSIPRLRALMEQGNPLVKEQLISTVKSKCGGMFLHASLQLDALQTCLHIHSVMRTLERFPAKVEDVYSRTWERILNQDSDHVALAKVALVWVLYAKHSLTIGELRHAVAVCPETHSFEEERLVPQSTITDLCYGLLTVDKESDFVRLVHYTAKQPMEDLLQIDFPDPHSLLAAACIACLKNCGCQNPDIDPDSNWAPLTTLNPDPLLSYAYEAWVFHAQESLHLGFIANRVSTFVAGCRAFPDMVIDGRYYAVHDTLRPLHIASFYNFPIAFAGPCSTHDTNAKTAERTRTPLHLACIQGHYAAAQSLLSLPSILLNERDIKGETPLIIACRKGNEGIVTLLLAHPDINVNLAKPGGSTPLTMACHYRYEAIVKLLLAHPDIEINLADNSRDIPLIVASRNNCEGIVELLLAHSGINVNSANHEGDTALINASRQGYEGVVMFLLADANIEVNLLNDNGDTALLLAASRTANARTVELLLAHPGTDANLMDEDGDTALINASREGFECIVALLLAHPAILVNLPNDGETALIAASSWDGNERTVELLLAHPDIEVNLPGEHGNTALMVASSKGHLPIAKLLLAASNIDVNRTNEDSATAIKIAAENGHEDIADILLEVPGIDTSVKCTRDGHTAISAALEKGHRRVVLVLQQFEEKHRVSQGISTSRMGNTASVGPEDPAGIHLRRPQVMDPAHTNHLTLARNSESNPSVAIRHERRIEVVRWVDGSDDDDDDDDDDDQDEDEDQEAEDTLSHGVDTDAP